MMLSSDEKNLLRTRLKLSERQIEIVGCLLDGIDSTSQIARRLGIAAPTVKLYLAIIYDKTDARSRLQLALLALRTIGRLAPP